MSTPHSLMISDAVNDTPTTSPVFSPPFDDADADLIVRSSDNVHFRMYKVILAKASGVFKNMFTVPQPEGRIFMADDEEIPGVVLTEDSGTLNMLFRLCYPVPDPNPACLGDISHLLAVCDKYEMEGIMKNLEKPLGEFTESDPLRVFAIACRAKFTETARQAARQCLAKPISYVQAITTNAHRPCPA